ncbi:hypothetical protein [Streptomyces spectabilis]|uniref:Uncharacterized protein n=1 Tax=Streptomyces spectabilis TaxID=68270 RepID=A0A7W8B133_STRST|nr:hypothetical protein [Streptomyces spectabilis]MBB5108316.1 hypothetical protein [Streptomyces spectabilis]MCI3901075.1 hypothetical protein [Streptomyces spectabilis]GGV45821.1 hypothetical protein GCM10010245_71780 [Streptomyces spectabilis]
MSEAADKTQRSPVDGIGLALAYIRSHWHPRVAKASLYAEASKSRDVALEPEPS